MIDKIVEAVLRDIVRRLDNIEEKILVTSTPKNSGVLNREFEKKKTEELATPGQIWKIKKEGGEPVNGLTKADATKVIDGLLKDKEIQKTVSNIVEPKEVDTDDAGLDSEDLM